MSNQVSENLSPIEQKTGKARNDWAGMSAKHFPDSFAGR